MIKCAIVDVDTVQDVADLEDGAAEDDVAVGFMQEEPGVGFREDLGCCAKSRSVESQRGK